MKGKFYPLILLAFVCLTARAQQAGVRYLHIPLSGTNVLRDIKDPYSAQVIHWEAPEQDGDIGQEELSAAKHSSALLFPYKASGISLLKGAAALQPVVAAAFVADSFSGTPPDNYNAVNTQHQAVNVMNGSVAILNTNTGDMVYRKTLEQFSAPVGLNNPIGQSYNYRYDPKVIYDPAADRFICVMLNGTDAHNWIVVGFSQTNDPSGAWNWYKFYGDYGSDNTWFDYPAIALTQHDFYVTGNKLGFGLGFQNGFRRSVIYQIRKADGYAGNTLTTKLWDSVSYGGAPIRNLFPVKGGSGLKGPAQHFLNVRNIAVQNDTVFLIKIPDTTGSIDTVMTVTPLVSNLNYGIPPNGKQVAPGKRLATNDGRVLGAYTEGNEIQFVSASVVPASGASGIYHGTISNFTSAPMVTAQMIAVDSLDFGYPNLSFVGLNAGKNTSIITFNYTGPQAFPGIGGVFWDGSSYSPMLRVKEGENYIKTSFPDSTERWGDYTGSQPSWGQAGSVWMVGIYGRTDRYYGNWMARLRSPFSTAVNDVPQNTTNAFAYPIPALRFIRIKFELRESQQIKFTVTDAQGRVVAPLLNTYCEQGLNELEFNTASLAAGVYYLNGSSTSGKLFTRTFIRE